jgi:hypothetical protein
LGTREKIVAGMREAIEFTKRWGGHTTAFPHSVAKLDSIAREIHEAITFKLSDLGFISPKSFNTDHWAAIIPRGSFFAIVDGDADSLAVGYVNRWHYGTLALAQEALEDWSGEGMPRGWFSRETPEDRAMTVWP